MILGHSNLHEVQVVTCFFCVYESQYRRLLTKRKNSKNFSFSKFKKKCYRNGHVSKLFSKEYQLLHHVLWRLSLKISSIFEKKIPSEFFWKKLSFLNWNSFQENKLLFKLYFCIIRCDSDPLRKIISPVRIKMNFYQFIL